MIKRRLKSVTQPRRKPKVVLTAEERKQRLKAKQYYKRNKRKILTAAKVRKKHLTTTEKAFNKKRAEFLKKTRPHKGVKSFIH